MKKWLILVWVCLLVGCAKEGPEQTNKYEKVQMQSSTQIAHANQGLSTWLVYWDLEKVQEELDGLGHLSALSYFEAYFNEAGEMVLPEGFLEDLQAVEFQAEETYLTFVNDIVYDKARPNSLKDIQILEEIFSDKARLKAHIEQIIQLTKQVSATGVEIDYENIRDNQKLWQGFEVFLKQLLIRTKQEGLKMRVVLETQTDFEAVNWPEDVEYVMMCYNLHGKANDIGAKADQAFLKETVANGKKLPQNTVYALATGGFDWSNHGEKVKAIKEQEALELIRSYQVKTVKRDDNSGALSFTYKDDTGMYHEVWFADGKTLRQWRQWILEEGGERIAIWRLNGNEVTSLEQVN